MPRRTVIPKSDHQRIEPDTSPEAWDFYRRHIIDPAMSELQGGLPLTNVLVLTYYLGMFHAMQLADKPFS